MGKNRRSSGGESKSNPSDYTKTNNNIIQQMIKELDIEMERNGISKGGIMERPYKYKKDNLNNLLEYCNKNNLEIAHGSADYKNAYGTYHSILSVIDHESGRTYSLYDDTFKGSKTLIDKTRSILDKLPSKYSQNTNNINFLSPSQMIDALGQFNINHANSITINTSTVDKKYDLERTTIHELAHSYDWNVLGSKSGHDSLENISSPFYDYSGHNHGPTEYSDRRPVETFSTVLEQVGMHYLYPDAELRSDAQMPDGKSVSSYDKWAEAWAPMVEFAEDVLEINK